MFMSYEDFKERAISELMYFLPESMRHLELKINKVYKVNETLDSIALIDENNPHQVVPNLYLKDMYDEYRHTRNFSGVMLHTAEIFMQWQTHGKVIMPNPEKVDLKDKVIFNLVNAERNRELLSQAPHRPYEDLAIIYRAIVNRDDGGVSTTIITNDVMEHMDLNEEELFRLAKENTDRLLPTTIRTMESKMQELFGEIAYDNVEPDLEDGLMWVISNNENFFGASAILNDGVMKFLADRLGEDLYLLPSSVNEWIVVKACDHDIENLREVVQEANVVAIDPKEFLSDSVYYFNCREKTFQVCQPEQEQELQSDNLTQQIRSAFRELEEAVNSESTYVSEPETGVQKEEYDHEL